MLIFILHFMANQMSQKNKRNWNPIQFKLFWVGLNWFWFKFKTKPEKTDVFN